MGHFALGQSVWVKAILRWEGVARRSCLYYNTGHFPLGYLAMGKNVLSQINDMFIQKEVTTLFRSSTASRFLAKESFECERKNWNTLIRPHMCKDTRNKCERKHHQPPNLLLSLWPSDIPVSGPNKSRPCPCPQLEHSNQMTTSHSNCQLWRLKCSHFQLLFKMQCQETFVWDFHYF